LLTVTVSVGGISMATIVFRLLVAIYIL
jgi:hypothetical protein